MSKKSFIDSVEVKTPCTEEWDKMTGTNKIRFCSHCAKDVNNISEMTRKEAMRLVRSAGPELCIRYIANPITRRPLFAEQLFQITRRATGLAAGVMSASISLSTLAYAQSEPPTENQTNTVTESRTVDNSEVSDENDDKRELSDNLNGVIEGTVRDLNGKPVPGVSVMLFSSESYSDNDNETTDELGHYAFENVKAGSYVIRIDSSSGVRRKIGPGLTLSIGQRIIQDVNVSLVKRPLGEVISTGFGFGGAMASVQYSLPLSQAVAEEDVDKVRGLLSGGADVNAKDENYDGITPLFIAVENGDLAVIRLLLDMGANPNAEDKTGRTPLMFIDSDATPELIKVLIHAGARINSVDDSGNTAILNAIGSAKPEVLQALIDAGADVNMSDETGDTPLMKAADNDDLESVKILVLAGADVNARNKRSDSVWDKASNVKIEEFLLTYGAVADAGTIEVFEPRGPIPR